MYRELVQGDTDTSVISSIPTFLLCNHALERRIVLVSAHLLKQPIRAQLLPDVT